jgi:hypothetical protein
MSIIEFFSIVGLLIAGFFALNHGKPTEASVFLTGALIINSRSSKRET